MSMDNRKRQAVPSNASNVNWSTLFPGQPARVLIVEALPPWWLETCTMLCDALDNFLSLACNLDGPCRIPLLSLYAISRQQECLLPFVQVRGNLARLRSCVEELRSIPGEGCIRGAAKGGELLRQAVLDSLQQFKQYIRHTSNGTAASNNTFLEVTVVTSQPGQGIVRHLEMGLKDADLVSLKRLLVVQIDSAAEWSQENPSPKAKHSEAEDSLMLGTEVDLQQVENSVLSMEMVLKAWLQEQGGDREQLHLLLPGLLDNSIPVCVKCDMQERLISPALISVNPNLGVKTESIQDFLPITGGTANQSQKPQRLKAIKALRADGVCAGVLYGLPLVIHPTTCWQLDWDEIETNHNLFHALCHTLQSRDMFLLLQVEPTQRSTAGGPGVYSHYVLQPSQSLSLLLKPVVTRELLLPCSLPVSAQEPTPDALQVLQGCVSQLDEEFILNPLSLRSNLYEHLKCRGVLSQSRYPYRQQPAAAHRDQSQPPEGPKSTGRRPSRQPQNQCRQLGTNSKVRATMAPIPSSSSSHFSSSSLGPPPARASRPTLELLLSSSSSRSRSSRAPVPTHREMDDNNDDPVVIE
ncbi:meiosis 1 arrest protein isoform X2 [Notolabrus celidotus]|uniref:meiosis 1 arrest protein isoform X2 n=1 Tax=Notolabrus celidotus TaxID=1203425 RepID=UPI00148F7C7A|nr:meiosis 1 arrest protein isoform X2 [Notolabrus celidotus]